MNLKAFSEGISTGSNYDSYAGEVKKVFLPKGIKRPQSIDNAVIYLRKVLEGKEIPDQVTMARKEIKDYMQKTVWTDEFLAKYGPAKRTQEGKFFSKVFTTRYPTKKALTAVEKITKSVKTKEKAAVDILKVVKAENKSLMKSLTKAAAKNLLPKIVGLLGLGLVGVELYKRVQGLISKEAGEEFGEFYHKDVGWY